MKICDECETVAHCTKHGCVPKQPAPVQEPFGYFRAEPFGWTDCAETDEGAIALYEHPAAQPAPVQEPFEYWNAVEGWVKIDEVREHFDSVGCGTIYKTAGDGRVPLTAAQRQWVGLTDEEIDSIVAMSCKKDSSNLDAARVAVAIEAKLKEKNTP
jgi:hypothetical protein